MVKDAQFTILRFETVVILSGAKNLTPRLGKIRLAKILNETGYTISPSTVTRILKLLQGDALQK